MGVYLHAKFEVSSIILARFRLEGVGNFTTPSPPQKEPLKIAPRLNGLSGKAILGLKYLGQILLPFKVKFKEINVSFKGILSLFLLYKT